MKVGAIIQARTGSTRFPNKILKELPYHSGITILDNVINRIKLSKRVNSIIIATTKNPEDDIIVQIAESQNVSVYRGSENDVLSRYYEAAGKNNIDTIVRVTSDCPCIEPQLIDELVELYCQGEYDYINIDTEKFPRGLDAEIFNYEILKFVYLNAKNPSDREHVTKYIYSNPQDFSIYKINPTNDNLTANLSRIRVTIDTFNDYLLLCALFAFLKDKKNYSLQEILVVFEENPWLYLLNDHIQQKKQFSSLEQEFSKVIPFLRMFEFHYSAEFLDFFNQNKQERIKILDKIEKSTIKN